MGCRSDASRSHDGQPRTKVGGSDGTKDIKDSNGAEVWRVDDYTFERMKLASLRA